MTAITIPNLFLFFYSNVIASHLHISLPSCVYRCVLINALRGVTVVDSSWWLYGWRGWRGRRRRRRWWFGGRHRYRFVILSDERVSKSFTEWHASGGFFDQKFGDEISGLRAYVLREAQIDWRDATVCLVMSLSFKGRCTYQKLVAQDSERPDIDSF